MTKKDYSLIGDQVSIVHSKLTPATEREKEITTLIFGFLRAQFASALTRTNPRFDCARFLKACLPLG